MHTKRRFILLVFFITSLTLSAQGARVHGTIYEWSDLEQPLKNAIVEVNSTPEQYIVAISGTYSFNLSPGSYLIKAKYYRNNLLEYSTEEGIQIDREGDFIHDLLLFPPTDLGYEYLGDINLTDDMDIKNENDLYYYIIPALVLILIVILYLIRKKISSIEPPAVVSGKIEGNNEELPPDLHNLYGILLEMGGRATQKELRKKLACSEAKVSLMLDDLEGRGLIKKIKKGRANIIIAEIKK